jgi:redox-sensitive bicupin YhaK (pirin superfamily)
MGNKGVIGAGDVQWMTAGSGVIHQEMPQISPSGTMWGFQFWANLPTSHKMMVPRYQDIKAAEIPEVLLPDGVKIKVIAGEVAGVRGPVRDIIIEPEMLDITVPAGETFNHEIPAGHTAFAYVLAGTGCFDEAPKLIEAETVLLYEHDGEMLQVTSAEKPLRFLLLSGKPLHEPVAWQGPIVMNTQEELRVAFHEFHNGTFIK